MSRFLFISIFFLIPLKTFADNDLQGFWKQNCKNKNYRTENFKEKIVTYTENYFTDSDCSQPILSLIVQGNYVILSQNIDFQYEFVHAVVSNELLLNEYNKNKTCGFSDWKINEEKDVTGTKCDLFGLGKEFLNPKVGDKKFGIWKIENNFLWFGQITRDLDGNTAEKRPNTWNQRYFIRMN